MKLKLAFTLFKYFPYGGLQRDFFQIAQRLAARGHHVHVYSTAWEHNQQVQFTLHLINAKGWQNHTRYQHFVQQTIQQLNEHHYDLVIGFNKMPGLDLYYAADSCFKERLMQTRPRIMHLMPRNRVYSAMEKAVFAKEKTTKIMLIAHQAKSHFERYYGTTADRFYLLPPNVIKERIVEVNANAVRQQTRQAFNITNEMNLILLIGSHFKTKGVDRALQAMAALPKPLRDKTVFIVIGKDIEKPYLKLAQQLGVMQHIHFLGARDDVPNFLHAADLLIHPARHENTGTVLLEALVAGLPILTLAHCGYAYHITQAQAGIVLPEPFQQTQLNASLSTMLYHAETRQHYRECARQYAAQQDLYGMYDAACALIEAEGARVHAPLP